MMPTHRHKHQQRKGNRLQVSDTAKRFMWTVCVCAVCVYVFIQRDEKRNFSTNKERTCLERGNLASQNNFKRLLEG